MRIHALADVFNEVRAPTLTYATGASLVLALIGSACGAPAYPRRGAEEDLTEPSTSAQKEPEEQEEVPLALREFHWASFPFEGTWIQDTEPGYAYGFLRIKALGETRYSIDFLHATHCGNSGHSFEAEWSGVALRTTTDSDYPRVLYPVRVDGVVGFVPGSDTVHLAKDLEPEWYAATAFWPSDGETFELYNDSPFGPPVFPTSQEPR